MLEQDYISQKQYDEALADDVYARIQTTNTASQADNTYSYFVDALAQQVIQDLKDQLGYTDTQAYNAVYSGGLSIILHRIRPCSRSAMKKPMMIPIILD